MRPDRSRSISSRRRVRARHPLDGRAHRRRAAPADGPEAREARPRLGARLAPARSAETRRARRLARRRRVCGVHDLLLFWGAKAERFAIAGGIDVAFLRDRDHWALHSDYPPLLSCVWAFASLVAGRFAWGACLGTLPVFSGFLVLAAWGLARLEQDERGAAASAALLGALLAATLPIAATAGNGASRVFIKANGCGAGIRRRRTASARSGGERVPARRACRPHG